MKNFNGNLKTESKRSIAKYCLLLSLMIIAPFSGFAQADIHFSQFYETSILRNPALTGVFENDYKLGAYFRSQWSTISHPYQTALVSGEYRVSVSQASNDYFSFGVLGYSDKAGSIDQRITGIYPAVNYNKCINEDHNTFLSAGFTGGYLQYSFDPAKATFNNQYQNGHFNSTNPTMENFSNTKLSFWDIGAGLNFNTSSGENKKVTYVLGFSGYHFTQPEFSYYQTPGITQNMRWNVNAAISRYVTDAVTVLIHSNYAIQNTYNELMIGCLVNWTENQTAIKTLYTFSGGVFYRYNDAIIPVVKIKYKNMAFGFSYDVNVSTLKPASYMQGGAEVTLFISGNTGDRSGIVKKTLCPRFF
ncbi:MAG: PorP/SprF family type IX secretion system membrane protein [Chitinophagales bacterium]